MPESEARSSAPPGDDGMDGLCVAADAVFVSVEVRCVAWLALIDGCGACGPDSVTVLVVHLDRGGSAGAG